MRSVKQISAQSHQCVVLIENKGFDTPVTIAAMVSSSLVVIGGLAEDSMEEGGSVTEAGGAETEGMSSWV
jgi:hypothetical protein